MPAAAEIPFTIAGGLTLTLNDHSSGPPQYLLRNISTTLATPRIRRAQTSLQADHGTVDGVARYDERVLPFSGEIMGSSQADRKELEDDLRECLGLPATPSVDGEDGYYLVSYTDEDGVLKQLYARIIEGPKFDVLDNSDPSRRGFGFVMVAKDPRVYSPSLQSASGDETFQGTSFQVIEGASPKVPFQLYEITAPTATCVNGGRFGAPPVITVTGPTTSPKVTNVTTGKFIELDGLTLTASQSVTINVGRKTITRNDGTNLSAYWGEGSRWWVLKPGSNAITLLDASPSEVDAALQVQWRNTWMP